MINFIKDLFGRLSKSREPVTDTGYCHRDKPTQEDIDRLVNDGFTWDEKNNVFEKITLNAGNDSRHQIKQKTKYLFYNDWAITETIDLYKTVSVVEAISIVSKFISEAEGNFIPKDIGSVSLQFENGLNLCCLNQLSMLELINNQNSVGNKLKKCTVGPVCWFRSAGGCGGRDSYHGVEVEIDRR